MERPTIPVALASIAANVRKLRERAGTTQERLAVDAGLDLRTIQRIESGTMNMRVGVLLAVANALDVPTGRLLRAAQLRRRGRGRPTTTRR